MKKSLKNEPTRRDINDSVMTPPYSVRTLPHPTKEFMNTLKPIEELIDSKQLQLEQPRELTDIPSNKNYFVYGLLHNDKPIVVGHGKRNRARVIFDNLSRITSPHLKALYVRLYHIYGNANSTFTPFLIPCGDSKEKAEEIEKVLHERLGGNHRNLPEYITDALFSNIDPQSIEWILLKIALNSSYDGLSDIKRWRKEKLIPETTWGILSEKLRLDRTFGEG